MWVRSVSQEDPLEEEMANCSIILAWRIQWIEEPGKLQVHTVANSQTQVKGLSMHTHASTIYKELIQLNSD